MSNTISAVFSKTYIFNAKLSFLFFMQMQISLNTNSMLLEGKNISILNYAK